MSVVAKAFGAGSDIDSYCGKCTMELAHVIIAMDGVRPAKVECKTCRSIHKYRGSVGKATKAKVTRKTTTRASGTRATGTRRAAKVSPEENFEIIMSNRDISKSRAYRANEEFVADDVLDHKTFGLGVVTREISGNKIEVCFQAGTKILVHNR